MLVYLLARGNCPNLDIVWTVNVGPIGEFWSVLFNQTIFNGFEEISSYCQDLFIYLFIDILIFYSLLFIGQ